MQESIKFDFYAAVGKKYSFLKLKITMVKMFSLKYIYFARKIISTRNPILRSYYNFRRFKLRRKYGIEVFMNNIGRGFRMVHAFNITISNKAIVGKNVTVFKGVTIGETFRGTRKGAPIIGNNVWIGPNATIVGMIKIGNDVLIAPNSFVNSDVPNHSIVIGNPGKIIYKENATQGYLRYFEDETND